MKWEHEDDKYIFLVSNNIPDTGSTAKLLKKKSNCGWKGPMDVLCSKPLSEAGPKQKLF